MTGRIVTRQIHPHGSELVAILHRRANHDVARADRIGDAAVASLRRHASLGYFRRAFALAHRLFDRAHRDAAAARALMAKECGR